MRWLIVVFACLPLLALSNKVTLQDKSGSGQGTRQWVITRYFAVDEICDVPKPYVSGTAATYWQAHVETRWPASAICSGGAAKIAVIILEAAVGSSASVEVDFRNTTDYCHLGNSATCAAAGASKTDLLDFDAGGGPASWGAKITATTGGISFSRSARTMITDDHYQIIRNGPIYTEVLVREGPDAVSAATTRTTNFGWKCTANCTGPYASATSSDDSAYYSIRPSFWLRFYRRWGKVEGDLVLHSGWMDRFVDQRIESYTISTGGAETTAAITQTNPIIISPRQTVWEDTFWNGGAPNAWHIDFNVQYLMYSRLMPTLNTSNLPTTTSTALEVTAFNATDKGVTTNASITPALGWGQINRAMYVAGSNAYVGLFPRWVAKYLATQDYSLVAVVLGNARALMHFPFSYLETAGSEWATGTGAAAFGRPASIEKRPTLMTWYQTAAAVTSYTTGSDRVTAPDGSVVTPSCGTCMVASQGLTLPWLSATSASWNQSYMDRAHQVADFFTPYMITGKPLFREALQHVASYNVGATAPYAGLYSDGRQAERGLMDPSGSFPRGLFWPLRAIGQAAVLSPDGTPEKTYYTRMLNNNIEVTEGKMGLTAGSFPPSSASAPYGCPSTTLTDYYNQPSSYASAWCIGRYVWMRGIANDMGWPGLATAPNSPTVSPNVDLRYGSEFITTWMIPYAPLVYGHLRDLGLTQIGPISDTINKLFLRLLADSGAGQDYSILGMYATGLMNSTDTAMLSTPSEVRAAASRSAQVAKAFSNSDTTFYVTKFANSLYTPGPAWETINGSGWIQVGSEKMVVTDQIYLRHYYWRGSISASTDTFTFTFGGCYSGGGCSPFDATGIHFLADGDLVTIANGGTAVLSGFPIAADTANCHVPSGRDYCTYYVKVISTSSIQLYKDSALTQLVDFTSDVASNAYAGLGQVVVMTTNLGRCGGVSCRGINGTTAASHSVGESVTMGAVWTRQTYQTDVDFGYASKYRSALSYAATYGASITDSITGKRVTGARAYRLIAGLTGYQARYGDTGSCTGLDVTTCGNPRWGWIPYQGPTNVRVAPSTGQVLLRYVAPDGRNCRVSVASSFSSSDDSGDSTDSALHSSRSQIFSGLPAGTYQYRITCGTGRVLGSVVVP